MARRWNRHSIGIALLVLVLSAVAMVPLVWLMGPHIRAEQPPGIGMWWVAFGFAAQALFASRLIVQWLVAERERRSVIPAAFWWLSLLGGLMLLVYFWRRGDPVGTAGQLFGTIIYLRNLQLLARERRARAAASAAAPPAVASVPAPAVSAAAPIVASRAAPAVPASSSQPRTLPRRSHRPSPGSLPVRPRSGRPAPDLQSRQRR